MKRLVLLFVLLVPCALAEQQAESCWQPIFGYLQPKGAEPATVTHDALVEAGMLENVVTFVEQTTDLSDYYGRQVSALAIAHNECAPGTYGVEAEVVQDPAQVQPGFDKRELVMSHQLARQEAYAPQSPSKVKMGAKIGLAAAGTGAGIMFGWPGYLAGGGINLLFNMWDSNRQQNQVAKRYKRSLEAQGARSFADSTQQELARAQYDPGYRQQPQTWAQEVAQIDTAGWR